MSRAFGVDEFKFQFQMVRLKALAVKAAHKQDQVSIPNGSIKSASLLSQSVPCYRVSIPNGSIKRS